MTWQQHMLVRYTKAGARIERMCWLPVDKCVHKGSIISLKGEKARWTVAHQYQDIRLDEPPLKKWQVGGLF